MSVSKRDVWAAVCGMVIGMAISAGWVSYFNWWERHNCSGSNGTWNETEERCIEPSG
jgi:hypothetical protein